MKLNRYAIPALALFLGATCLVTARSYGVPPGPPTPASAQDRDHDRNWDAPPGELNEIQRRGFHDGLEGAHRDFDNHRRPEVRNRDEYRHPHVPGDQREAYRDGFRRGYEVGVRHLWGGHDHDHDHDRQ